MSTTNQLHSAEEAGCLNFFLEFDRFSEEKLLIQLMLKQYEIVVVGISHQTCQGLGQFA